MSNGKPNEHLAGVLLDAGMSHKALARAVRDLSARRGRPVSCDHTSVSRWLAGTRPRPGTARLVVEVLAAKLGRPVTLADIGLPGDNASDPSPGSTSEGALVDCVVALTRLWRCDLEGVKTVVASSPEAAAWSEAALSWLTRPEPEVLICGSHRRRIGLTDVDVLRSTVAMFAELDNRFGGGHARHSLISYLNADLGALLQGTYTEKVGRKLFSAAAESTLLAAWMSYDSGNHGLAQRYFIRALRLAQAGDDLLLAGSILDAMSHQATFLGRHREAINLARAARTGAGAKATATQAAHFHAMEARALAAAGDSAGTHRALGWTLRIFEHRRPSADPEWIRYFDVAELNAELSHCFRDIGRHGDAMAHAEDALAASPGTSPRSDLFMTMVRATGLLGAGDLEESLSALRSALKIGRTVRSARCAGYVRSFLSLLADHGRHRAELDEEYADHPLWPTAR